MTRPAPISDAHGSALPLIKGRFIQLVRYYFVDGLSTHELISGRFVKKTAKVWQIEVGGDIRTLPRSEWLPCSN